MWSRSTLLKYVLRSTSSAGRSFCWNILIYACPSLFTHWGCKEGQHSAMTQFVQIILLLNMPFTPFSWYYMLLFFYSLNQFSAFQVIEEHIKTLPFSPRHIYFLTQNSLLRSQPQEEKHYRSSSWTVPWSLFVSADAESSSQTLNQNDTSFWYVQSVASCRV